MDLIEKHIPETFYAGLPSEERLKMLVKHWQRSIETIQKLEKALEDPRLKDALLCVENISMHEETQEHNLKTDKERDLHSALNKIYRISHVARKPVCFDKHEDWEKEFQEFIPVAKR